jgi:hypothetical protein
VSIGLERMWTDVIMTFRYYTGMFLEEVRKAVRSLGQSDHPTEILIGNVKNTQYKSQELPSETVNLVRLALLRLQLSYGGPRSYITWILQTWTTSSFFVSHIFSLSVSHVV